jgi:hypothetical protein
MDITIGVALAETSTHRYERAIARVLSADDIEGEIIISDRRGEPLASASGMLESDNMGGWAIGDTWVKPSGGCGCGGVGIQAK